MRRAHWAWPAALLLALAPTTASGQEDFGGLPAGPGQEDVYHVCNACHSIRLVTQQRLSRTRWDHLLEWMVEEQGMPVFEPDDRERVLDYLATHFGQDVPR